MEEGSVVPNHNVNVALGIDIGVIPVRALEKNLKVMDASAFRLAQEKSLPIIVFNLFQPNALQDIVTGKNIGSLVM